MILFVSGLLVMGYVVAALHFAKFRRQSGDRLFALFALAFLVLAAQRSALAFSAGRVDAVWVYALRLLAFLIILGAIVDKNRGSKAGPR